MANRRAATRSPPADEPPRRRSAVRLCRRGSLLAARNVKPECDLRLILFNELPINEGNSRQR